MSEFDTLIARGEGLFTTLRPLKVLGANFGRRMNVIVGPEGKVMLQSAFVPSASIRAAIDALGPVEAIVIPTRFHDTFLDEVAVAYPDATYYYCEGAESLPADGVAKAPLNSLDPSWNNILESCLIAGMPMVNETAFLHKPSGTLLVSDLVFNVSDNTDFWTRTFAKVIGVAGNPGPSRLFRSVIKDKAAFLQSMDQISAWDFNTIIPSHFEIVAVDAPSVIKNILTR